MKRITDFSLSLADNFLRIFLIIFPIYTPSEKSVHPEEEPGKGEDADSENGTESEEIAEPEKESTSEEIVDNGEEPEPAIIAAHEEKPAPRMVTAPEEESESEEIADSEQAFAAETIPEPEKASATEAAAGLETEKEADVAAAAETESQAITNPEKRTASRSMVEQNMFSSEEYRATEFVTGLVGSILGVLTIVFALVLGAIGVTFKFDGTGVGNVLNIASPVFAVLAIIGVIVQRRYPKIGGWLIIVAAVEGFLAIPFLFLPSGISLLIAGYMGIQRGNHQGGVSG